ncbi:zinc finger protein, predicted [Trypanosoma grayi]|uniref:zinc finger protein, predicted n=1 Tax=Trypanosoma grayi TaxID=71804 RepID=UPI0004F3F1F2|nr:zinc finger protein, predicted [Trypanosoma grayi]KEG10841.1 zinc finger protein, predicted [Trypanosoma grayi]
MSSRDENPVDEEPNIVVQFLRDHVAWREQAGLPLVLQLQRERRSDGEQVTIVLGRMDPERRAPGGDFLEPGGGGEVPVAPLPFVAGLSPLLLQVLTLQVLLEEQRRRMAAPLGQEEAKQLQKMRLDPDIIVRLEADGQGVCSICQDSFLAGTEVCRLPCGHMFDTDCLEHWFRRTRTCPNCRFLLQDVAQQYKDVVAPVWWRTTGDEEDGSRLKEDHSLAETRVMPEAVTEGAWHRNGGAPLVAPMVVGMVEEVRSGLQRQEAQRQSVEQMLQTLPHSGPVSSLMGISNDSRQASSGGAGDRSILQASDLVEPRGLSLLPVPPSASPQRMRETFRDRFFADGASAQRTVDSRGSRLDIRNWEMYRSSPVQAPHGSPLSPSREQVSEHVLPSPGVWTATGGSPLLDPVTFDMASSTRSSSLRLSRDTPDNDVSTHMPRVAPYAQEVARASAGVRRTRNGSPVHQRRQLASGNARHAVHALRNNRVEDVRIPVPPNGIRVDDANMGRPPRYRTNTASRLSLCASPPSDASVRRLSHEHRQRGNNNHLSSSEAPEEAQGLRGTRPQAVVRGNRHNTERYEAVIRGVQRR